MSSRRDNFPVGTVRTLGMRAGYICSNPDCRRPTAGPHSDPTKALITGIAAHICAAGENGPRYDAPQSKQERKSITNAIWLCGTCSKRIDTDWLTWPSDTLLQMKIQHESWIGSQGMVPKLLEVTVTTLEGLRLTSEMSTICKTELETIREQELAIVNSSRVPLLNLKLEMYLHEPVIGPGKITHNAGTKIQIVPLESPWTVSSAGNGAVKALPKRPMENHILEIPVISPDETIVISFYTCDPNYQLFTDPTINVGGIDIDSIYTGFKTPFFLEGAYQFLFRGEYVPVDIFVPLRYSFKGRKVVSFPAQNSRDPWEAIPTMRWSGVQLSG